MRKAEEIWAEICHANPNPRGREVAAIEQAQRELAEDVERILHAARAREPSRALDLAIEHVRNLTGRDSDGR